MKKQCYFHKKNMIYVKFEEANELSYKTNENFAVNYDIFGSFRFLQRVTPKVDATISHELYVFHRWGLIRYASEASR